MREINTESFDVDVLQSEAIVVVDFWAPWCGPCKMLTPTFQELAEENKGIGIFNVNVDENPKLAADYTISSIPAVLIFQNGQVVEKLIGVKQKSAYQLAIDSLTKEKVG